MTLPELAAKFISDRGKVATEWRLINDRITALGERRTATMTKIQDRLEALETWTTKKDADDDTEGTRHFLQYRRVLLCFLQKLKRKNPERK